jgi:hypothetical protein
MSAALKLPDQYDALVDAPPRHLFVRARRIKMANPQKLIVDFGHNNVQTIPAPAVKGIAADPMHDGLLLDVERQVILSHNLGCYLAQ